MDKTGSLSHTKWECKYHVVFIPKYRKKILYKGLRQHLGEIFRKLAEQKESQIRYEIPGLAHQLKDKMEAAYQCGDLFAKRKRLMTNWAQFCDTLQAAKADNVVSIRKRKAL